MPQNVLLVAEDSADDALLLERALRLSKSSFRMIRVANGDDCIAYIEGTGNYSDRSLFPSPKVVLLDLKMPRKDGFEVLQWRQQIPAAAGIPVVVFSSSGLSADIARAYRLGANSYVIKPISPERLELMVKSLHGWWDVFNTPTPSAA